MSIVYEEIPQLLAQGKTRQQIAEHFGVTLGSLQVMCARFGVSLKDGSITPRPPRRLRPITVKARLNVTQLQSLRMRAKLLGMSCDDMATALLSNIVADNLYDAVMES